MASNNASPSVTASASAPQTANTTPSSPSSKSSSRSYPSPPPIPSSPSATTHSHGDSHTKRRSRTHFTLKRGDTSATDLLQKIKNVQQVTQENNIKHKGENEANSHASIQYIFKVKGSVIPNIVIPGVVITLWALFWVAIYMHTAFRGWATSPFLISIISVVLGLLLVFRTNTAYDRYWEGRRQWATLTTHCRNIARLVWITANLQSEREQKEARGVMNLVLAYPIAVKHQLRSEFGTQHSDLAHLLIHVPGLDPMQNPDLNHIPLEITYYIASYVARARKAETIDMQTQVGITTALSGLVDCLTSFERIKNTPIPLAYSIHLRQVVLIYLLSLPFQLVSALFYATIPVVAIAAFTFFGIEAIAGQIENPFGYDENDLAIESFVSQIRFEVHQLLSMALGKQSPTSWGLPHIDPSSHILSIAERKAAGEKLH